MCARERECRREYTHHLDQTHHLFIRPGFEPGDEHRVPRTIVARTKMIREFGKRRCRYIPNSTLCARTSTTAVDSFLEHVPGLNSVAVPPSNAGRPGCYAGVRGRVGEHEVGEWWWWIEVGHDTDDVETQTVEHANRFPHWRTRWVGPSPIAEAGPYSVNELEDKLKEGFGQFPGVFIIENGHRNSFLIVERHAGRAILDVTMELEHLFLRTRGTRRTHDGVNAAGTSEGAITTPTAHKQQLPVNKRVALERLRLDASLKDRLVTLVVGGKLSADDAAKMMLALA